MLVISAGSTLSPQRLALEHISTVKFWNILMFEFWTEIIVQAQVVTLNGFQSILIKTCKKFRGRTSIFPATIFGHNANFRDGTKSYLLCLSDGSDSVTLLQWCLNWMLGFRCHLSFVFGGLYSCVEPMHFFKWRFVHTWHMELISLPSG